MTVMDDAGQCVEHWNRAYYKPEDQGEVRICAERVAKAWSTKYRLSTHANYELELETRHHRP